MSRDPARIDRVLGLLERYWKKYPDLRLAQIVCNLAPARHGLDPYNVEDDHYELELMSRLHDDEFRVSVKEALKGAGLEALDETVED